MKKNILRNSIGLVNLPMPHTDCQKRGFNYDYSGAYLWNNFPENVRKIHYLAQFKSELDRISDFHAAIM